jgi:RNA polymerase sigma-70 factor (ECF subfamily)
VTDAAVQQAVDTAFRDEWGRVVATLIRRTNDWDLAEDCAQEAFAQALKKWQSDGIPRRPGAWLTTVAGRLAIDRLRRLGRGAELMAEVARETPTYETEEEAMRHVLDPTGIEDDRLRLIFTCCHPALPLGGRVSLTLRTLTGLTTAEIARAFLVSEATMAKRLTRTKAKIAAAAIPYRVPRADQLPERMAGVLAVLYLLFNQGYSASGTPLVRVSLCEEAIRLARAVHELMPDDPEPTGALALMLLQHSRRDARLGNDGALVTLEEQDRMRWDRAQIRDGLTLLDDALRIRRVGPYQLQAAIAACHARAPSAGATDWDEIVRLYELLEKSAPSPVVSLNKAVAVAMAGDIGGGLRIVDEVGADRRLAGYYLLEATRADLLRRRGEVHGALAAYDRAIQLAPSEPERRYLRRRSDDMRSGGA